MILHFHDPTWSQEFQRLEAAYQQSLGTLVCRVEHVGSTAIEGIAAKPILDIDLVISDIKDFQAAKEGLEKIGYLHNGDQGIPGREVFKRLDGSVPHSKRARRWMMHHLYVCVEGSRELDRHIRFRDYLNTHATAKAEYELIKREIEARSKGDRKIYSEIKENEGICTAFVAIILKKAEQAAGENADHADSFGHIHPGVSQPGRWQKI
jgi:GrpB-like predicted nucleotidyltransferase (UPF0157 family)